LIRDGAGNLCGATSEGGALDEGVLYKVDTAGRETVLHSFTGGADGASPSGNLLLDSAGNLYGTAFFGGVANGKAGFGVVYRVDAAGQESVLYSFTGGTDGGNPKAGVVRDPEGNLYGTTLLGGAAGEGVVFKLDTSGRETVLHTFTGGTDGGEPEAGVIRDSGGNLYGTTFSGGAAGAGVVYMLSPSGQETVLYSFAGFEAAGNPYAGVVRDPAGNLYGTTVNGGTTSSGGAGEGAVFEVDAAGTYSVLYTFTGGADGGVPFMGVVRDPAGNLYGATSSGRGVVYEIGPSGQFTVLYAFAGGRDGDAATASLMLAPAGDIYGPAYGGSSDGGLLFKLTLQ
jgi:uncharacterized repeat protein (TIGR03803 family)